MRYVYACGLGLSLIALAPLIGASAMNSSDANDAPGRERDLTSSVLADETAYVPAQCYTKTTTVDKQSANPCFSCHTQGESPNFLDDSELQLAYDFANPDRTAKKHNPWHNLFKDRSDAVDRISDAAIRRYVRQSNYRGANGQNTLASSLADLPAGWDADGDGQWDGYVPDVYFRFDDAGFDRGPDGDYSGWRSYAYTPLPGSFLPTNGSFDDVLIRLPKAFRQRRDGTFDRSVYQLNFAIVEALIKKHDIVIDPVDETDYGVDLNRDGQLDTAHSVVYDWAPLEGRDMSWVGRARDEHAKLAAGLFPKGTEFIHTLRYLDVDDAGDVVRAPRMKELRYARKQGWFTYSDLRLANAEELKEAHDFPDRPARFRGDVEQGLANGKGWIYQGFIEDKAGALRPQTVAETTSCMGCHGGVGRTVDSTFSFSRKVDAHDPQHGWTFWNQRPVATLDEPRLADGRYEYENYLRVNRAGDEYRSNDELIDRFFKPNGEIDIAALARLHDDIGTFLLPSAKRARLLNKAYRLLVEEQSFNQGREAHVKPLENVYRRVEVGRSTGIDKPLIVEHADRSTVDPSQ